MMVGAFPFSGLYTAPEPANTDITNSETGFFCQLSFP